VDQPLFLDRPAVSHELLAKVTEALAWWLPSEEVAGPVARWGREEWLAAGWVVYWHNALPWLAGRVRGSGARLPDEVAEALYTIEEDSRERTRRMLDNAVELLETLEAEAIQAIPLKGAVLATAYYPDPLTRPMADLDLLIRKRDVGRTVEILGGLGYRFFSRSAEDEVFLRGDRQANIWAADNVHPVEVHYTLREEYAGIGYNLAREMWSNSHQTSFWGGVQALLPRPASLLHHVCAHATSDWLIRRGRLMQIDDVRRIWPRMDQREWDHFANSISTSGARFVYPALAFAARYARLAIPPAVDSALRKACSPELLAWIESTGLGENSESNPADRTSLGITIARRLANSPADRVRFLLRSLFPRRWNLSKRYPRLVETPFWMLGYFLINADRLLHVIRRRLPSGRSGPRS